MRFPARSLTAVALAAAILASKAQAGGIPGPFDEPETSRPAVRKTPAQPPPTDGQPAPDPTPPGPGLAVGTIERETLPPIEAAPLPAPPSAPDPSPATAARAPSPAAAWPPDASQTPAAQPPPALDARSRTVMRDDLAPVMATDGTGLPYELWHGLGVAEIEKLVAAIEIPPRSPALHALFRRLMTSDVPPSAGGANDPRFTAVRLDALERAGLTDEAAALLGRESAAAADPALAVVAARIAIARGDREGGCRNAQALSAAQRTMPAALKGPSILVGAYCAAAAGKPEAVLLQATIAREEGVEGTAGLDAIEAIASGAKPSIRKDQKIGPIDWRILELGGAIDSGDMASFVESAGPGVLALVARERAAEPALRLVAAEGAARVNAITPDGLADAYRTFPGGETGGEGPVADAVRRAALFQSAVDERTPLKKARLIRSFLDEARRSGLYWPALQMIAPAASAIGRVPEIGWFAETAIETSLASGDFAGARSWAGFAETLDGPGGAAGGFVHWLALADVTDPAATDSRSRHLAALEEMGARGRFTPDQLHRLATVLDALEIQVPIPLWDLASRTPQPTAGFLPETGVLSALADAAKKKEFGRTVLLAMQALGPNGADGAHIIALGDSIRALRRANLETDARKLALEALFLGWPRAAGL